MFTTEQKFKCIFKVYFYFQFVVEEMPARQYNASGYIIDHFVRFTCINVLASRTLGRTNTYILLDTEKCISDDMVNTVESFSGFTSPSAENQQHEREKPNL